MVAAIAAWVVAWGVVAGPAAAACEVAAWSAARTEHGHPDIQGVWATEFLTPLERPEGFALVVDPADAGGLVQAIRGQFPHNIDPDFEIHGIDRLVRVRGELRASIVVDPEDGKIPYTQDGVELVQRLMQRFLHDYDDPEQRPLPERCLENLGFAPIRALPLFLPKTVFQSRDHVLIHSEDAVGLRTIHLHGDFPPEEIRSVEGYSIGSWEGDTLVVETRRFRADWPGRTGLGRPVLLSPSTRIVERFTRVSESELVYRFTVTDGTLYTRPWTGELSLTRHDGRQYEYACHEGNYSLPFTLQGGQAEQDRGEAPEN